jgi:O-antigen ligase
MTRMSGEDRWDGWWKFPLALLLVTIVLIVAAVVIQGTGTSSFSSGAAGQGDAPANTTGGP